MNCYEVIEIHVFHVVLFEPEIPPNTGNVIRLCANAGAHLHLIQPLGFELSDSRLRRAGLDYREWAKVQEHEDLDKFLLAVGPLRTFAFSTRAKRLYTQARFQPGDTFLFGPETRGLPDRLWVSLASEQQLRIPMFPGNRSLNLSNAVAIVLYEAWRQHSFMGATGLLEQT